MTHGGYVVNNSNDFKQVSDRESMWFSNNNVSVFEVIYVTNVYDEIQKFIAEGKNQDNQVFGNG